MEQRTLCLTAEERRALEQTRDRDQRPYLRERAAALLKVADGRPAYLVARQDLHKPRHPDTVYAWLDRYEADGLPGLVQHPRRHRGFSPSAPIGPLVRPAAGAGHLRYRSPPLAAG